MAQALLEKALEDARVDGVEVDSAGMECGYGSPMAEYTKNIIEERGILFTHTTQPLSARLERESDLLITMTASQKAILKMSGIGADKLFCIDDFTHEGDIADPYGGTREDYARVARQLDRACKCIVAYLRNTGVRKKDAE